MKVKLTSMALLPWDAVPFGTLPDSPTSGRASS